MPPHFRNLDSDNVSGGPQASDGSSTQTFPQRVTEESPSSPPILSDQSSARIRDTPPASPHGQNLGDRRRSSTSIGGRLAAPRRRLGVINSRRDSQRSVDRTPNRVVRPRHRTRTIRDNRRTGSFLHYVSSVEDLSRAISGVQQTGQPQRGDRQPLASHPSEMPPRRTRTFRVRSWRDPPTPNLLFPIPEHHVLGQSIHTPGPQPSHPSANRVTTPPAEAVRELSRLSIDSQGSTDSDSTEHDTQPPVRPNRLRYPGHVLYCDCSVCDMLNEPCSP
ncbi:hypothetical protein FVEG_17390 [Fusarium verticillioides 7600]|uniref:Uncharacterized protein n=1 Tax=Gibberella moniliformis (strain M3125 / FGSC 7600) TaxID=334819 RepID=W7MTH1_GIBM7|nr:hypothetical protein FVEG_17390 [Fusarium verticillioides 7600]EWG54763.1 hypothetical protein FVEG_17390 [Fusarium verticillioides 7600]RBQ83058.1 hypothetical protein FVER53263_20458 [Fusarium verticillioides]